MYRDTHASMGLRHVRSRMGTSVDTATTRVRCAVRGRAAGSLRGARLACRRRLRLPCISGVLRCVTIPARGAAQAAHGGCQGSRARVVEDHWRPRDVHAPQPTKTRVVTGVIATDAASSASAERQSRCVAAQTLQENRSYCTTRDGDAQLGGARARSRGRARELSPRHFYRRDHPLNYSHDSAEHLHAHGAAWPRAERRHARKSTAVL